ncbi:MAG TPA: GNAT family N-acetyltransferase [Thermoanaerobaculia bacterium]|nr:GNAT family N-acetyltransferase [Thermoanaerobaculia bacterium]
MVARIEIALAPQVTFRPIAPDDMDFLLRVYHSTREEELAMVMDWTAEQKDAFVQQQFQAQHAWYQDHYQGAQFDVILVDGAAAGRLYVHRRNREIRLVDITLLPEFRRTGIGTSLLKELLAEGEAAGKPVTIHVEVFNPAMQLYERLGFSPIEERGPYRLMEWKSPQLKTAS